MKRPYLILLIILAVVAGFFLIAYLYPASPTASRVSRRQEQAVQARIDQHQRQAQQAVQQGDAALGQADQHHQSAQQLRQEAVSAHQQSRTHVPFIPTSDSAVLHLQRQLATYPH